MVEDPEEEELRRRRRNTSIWKLFKPTDVTLYDLIYEPYLGRENYSEGGGEEMSEREREEKKEAANRCRSLFFFFFGFPKKSLILKIFFKTYHEMMG